MLTSGGFSRGRDIEMGLSLNDAAGSPDYSSVAASLSMATARVSVSQTVTSAPARTSPAPSPGNEPIVHIRASGGYRSLGLGELWRYRELVQFIVWRDVKVRYKQTVLGVAWAV